MVVVLPEASTLQFAHSGETRIPFMFIESHLAQRSQPSFLLQAINPSHFFENSHIALYSSSLAEMNK